LEGCHNILNACCCSESRRNGARIFFSISCKLFVYFEKKVGLKFASQTICPALQFMPFHEFAKLKAHNPATFHTLDTLAPTSHARTTTPFLLPRRWPREQSSTVRLTHTNKSCALIPVTFLWLQFRIACTCIPLPFSPVNSNT